MQEIVKVLQRVSMLESLEANRQRVPAHVNMSPG